MTVDEGLDADGGGEKNDPIPDDTLAPSDENKSPNPEATRDPNGDNNSPPNG